MNLNFQRQFEEYLVSQENLEPRKIGSYSITYLSRPCLLSVYRLYTEKHPLNIEKLKLFAIGDILHLGFQRILQHFKGLVAPIFESRHSVKLEDFEVVGKPDVVAYSSPVQSLSRIVIELKTCSPWAFRKIKKCGALEHHVLQLQGYLHLADASQGFLVYIKQTDGSIAEFSFERNEEAWQTLLDRAIRLHKCLLEKTSPEANPCWFCGYCEFKGDCKHALRKDSKD